MEAIERYILDKKVKEIFDYKRLVLEYNDQKVLDEAAKIDRLQLYSSSFRIFLKRLIIEDKLRIDQVLTRIPSEEIISRDEKTTNLLNYVFRTDKKPLSYEVTESLIKTGYTDKYPENLYYQTEEDDVKAPFTVEELISSTEYVKKNKK